MPLRALEEKISNSPQFNPGRPLWFYFYLPLANTNFQPHRSWGTFYSRDGTMVKADYVKFCYRGKKMGHIYLLMSPTTPLSGWH